MSLFLSIKNVQQLTNLQPTAAQRKLAKVRKVYHIAKYEQVPIALYCEYYKQDVRLALEILS